MVFINNHKSSMEWADSIAKVTMTSTVEDPHNNYDTDPATVC